MFKHITVEPELADLVNKELHTIKVPWQYLPLTTKYYELTDDAGRAVVDGINQKYGPVVDTQKFTWEIYNKSPKSLVKSFDEIKLNPNSRYNALFPNVAKLVNHLQTSNNLNDYEIIRLIVNMQTIRPHWAMNAPHPDFRDRSFITILYYANNSDGDTYFFNGSECVNRVSPNKGTAVMYPSYTLHAGSTPTKTETRVVINICFAPKLY